MRQALEQEAAHRDIEVTDAEVREQGAKAVEQFQKDFQQRWQNRTACREGYAATGCADGAADSED